MPRGRNVLGHATLQKRLWTPEEIMPDLGFWYDAADLSTFTIVSGAISQWRDKSGRGRNAAQSDVSKRPTFVANGQNNMAVVRATAQGQILQCSSRFSCSGIAAIMAYSKSGNGANDNDSSRFLELSGTTNGAEADKVGFSQGLWIKESYTVPTTPFKISGVTRSNMVLSGSYIPLFGALLHNGVSPYYATGYDSLTKYYGLGSIGEVVVITIADSALISKIEGYMAWKWNVFDTLSATHQFRNRPPLIGD